MDSRAAVAFVWAKQEGFFELARKPSQRFHLTREEALNGLDDKRYFAPLARKRSGSKKDDVALTGNVLWADIDHLDAPDRAREGLMRLGIEPSLLIYSGNKGFWIYLKLDRHIETNEIESMNRGLAALVDGDACADRTRLARLPGSINLATGNLAKVVDATFAEYDPADLVSLRASGGVSSADAGTISLPQLTYANFPAAPVLSERGVVYIRSHPRRNEGYDRSAEEQRIFTALIHEGWTDEEIVGFANASKLPRHLQELARHGDTRWTARSLANARAHVEKTHPTPISTTPMCRESVTYQHVDRSEALKLLTGQPRAEAIQTIITTFGCSKRTAQRVIKQLIVGGFVSSRRDGRSSRLTLTEQSSRHINGRFRKLMVVPTLTSITKSP